MTEVRIAFTVIVAILFAWSIWAWRRAEPGSPSAFYLRVNTLLTMAFLLTLAPPLIWPADSGMVLLVALFALVPFTMVVVAFLRRRRERRL
jgi:hypothetical protein